MKESMQFKDYLTNSNYGNKPTLALGIEIEYLCIDDQTHELASSDNLRNVVLSHFPELKNNLKTEFNLSTIEITTAPNKKLQIIRKELQNIFSILIKEIKSKGINLLASATTHVSSKHKFTFFRLKACNRQIRKNEIIMELEQGAG